MRQSATDLLRATSLDTLRSRMADASDRDVLSACASIAAEIDGCIEMGGRVLDWDTERFDELNGELVRRGVYPGQ